MKHIYTNNSSIIFKNEFQDFETGRLLSPVETRNYTIVQVADSYYGSRFSIPAHPQYCDLEITFSLSGVLLCANDGVWKKLGRHEAFLSYPGDSHRLKSVRGCRFQTLAFNVKDESCMELLRAVKACLGEKKSCRLPEIAELLSTIIAEFVSDDLPFSEHHLDSLITAILVRLSRSNHFSKAIDVLSTQDALPGIVSYLDTHFLEIHSLADLSSQFGYNYNHICKTFKKCYGIAPNEYLLSKKMEYAVKLLKDGKSVKYISEHLGYSTPYNFSRAFKSHYGASPLNYLDSV